LQKSKQPLVRECAAQVLGQRGSPLAVPLLAHALSRDENKWVRARAAEALGRLASAAAIPPLTTALAREKDPRIRRMIAQALVRHGQGAGVKELMWQLKSGTNNSKAEVMAFLVEVTGQPLGQDADAWWSYLYDGGQLFVARRAPGSPALLALRGVAPHGSTTRRGPFLHARKAPPWREVPAVVLDLEPTGQPLTRAMLKEHERERGAIPDGVLLLLRTAWREAKPKAPPRRPSPKSGPGVHKVEPLSVPSAGPAVPRLEPDAARYLLERAPKLLGVGIDAPSLDAPGAEHPTRDLLVAAGRLALESVGDLDRVVTTGARVLLLPRGHGAAASAGEVTIFVVTP